MGTPPNFRVRAAPGPALGAQTVSARRMGRIRRFRQHKISRKKTGRKDRDLLRQVKNIPKVFQICPWYIVKADCPDVKNYSHLPRREKRARTRLRCGAGPRVHIIYIICILYLLGQRVVLADPILHMDNGILLVCAADHHPVDARVDDHAAAHGAGRGVVEQLAGFRVAAG